MLLPPVSGLEKCLIWYARYFPISHGKMRIVNSFWRTVANSGSTQRTANLKYGAFKMPCDLNEMLQRQYYFYGTYFLEDEILECWQREARGASVIFDVGANAGIFSLAALEVAPGADVHAFEPTPEIAARLRETVALNKLSKLHVHEVAVAAGDGHAALVQCRGGGDNEGMNFIRLDSNVQGAERVKTVGIDQFCASHSIDHIDLLKLDVQGHEATALKGAERMLLSGKIRTIFVELNWALEGSASCPATETVRLLQEAGFSFAIPAKRMEWKQHGDWMRAVSDVVARRITR